MPKISSNDCHSSRRMNDENNEILIDFDDNEDEFTSSGISEDEEDDEEQEEEDDYQEGNILQPINPSNQRNNIHFIQVAEFMEANLMNNDHLLAQTMAVLAAKHRHTKSGDSTPTHHEILSFVGPCPLYSLASSFGLDMHHGLSYFPCRDVLANGGGHYPAPPLWQHFTSYHNLNLSSSSLLISHLILRGYSSSTPILFDSTNTKNILRTTPRYFLMRKCPLTHYGVYGIHFEHGARLCSGYTYNSNIYSHLIAFHKMTHDAALRLSRAIAFYDKQFQFAYNEIIVNESNKCSLVKLCQIRKTCGLKNHQAHLFKKIRRTRPVKTISN